MRIGWTWVSRPKCRAQACITKESDHEEEPEHPDPVPEGEAEQPQPEPQVVGRVLDTHPLQDARERVRQ